MNIPRKKHPNYRCEIVLIRTINRKLIKYVHSYCIPRKIQRKITKISNLYLFFTWIKLIFTFFSFLFSFQVRKIKASSSQQIQLSKKIRTYVQCNSPLLILSIRNHWFPAKKENIISKTFSLPKRNNEPKIKLQIRKLFLKLEIRKVLNSIIVMLCVTVWKKGKRLHLSTLVRSLCFGYFFFHLFLVVSAEVSNSDKNRNVFRFHIYLFFHCISLKPNSARQNSSEKNKSIKITVLLRLKWMVCWASALSQIV